MTKQTKFKTAIALTLVTVASLMVYFSSNTFQGMYLKGTADFLKTDSSRSKEIAWNVKQFNNSVTLYELNGIIGTTTGNSEIAKFNGGCKRSGIVSVNAAYGSLAGIARCSTYNASVSDTSRFTGLVAEMEPQNAKNKDSAYAVFYNCIRSSSTYCKSKKMMSGVYMGWPTLSCWDSIVKYTDVILLHCYISSTLIASGRNQYAYLNAQYRLSNIAHFAKMRGKKQNVIVLYSDEPTFSYDYFKTHTWTEPFALLKAYWPTAPDSIKSNINLIGRQIFSSSYAKELKP